MIVWLKVYKTIHQIDEHKILYYWLWNLDNPIISSKTSYAPTNIPESKHRQRNRQPNFNENVKAKKTSWERWFGLTVYFTCTLYVEIPSQCNLFLEILDLLLIHRICRGNQAKYNHVKPIFADCHKSSSCPHRYLWPHCPLVISLSSLSPNHGRLKSIILLFPLS